jgi:hypothetical protein
MNNYKESLKVSYFFVRSFSLFAQRKRTKRKDSRSLAASLLIPRCGISLRFSK